MATARASYTWAEDQSVAAAVDVETSYLDAVAEATARCRALFRDVTTDLAVDIAAVEDERPET